MFRSERLSSVGATGVGRPPARTVRSEGKVEIVVPVYNEEKDLPRALVKLREYLQENFPHQWQVTVVDNGSTDRTWEIATEAARTSDNVHAVHLDQKGRGRALKEVWKNSKADVVAYVDVDLSTRLDALTSLVQPLLDGESEVAIGSRLAKGASTERGLKREVISRGYNLMIRLMFRNKFSDAQCGFKAVRADAAKALLPLVQDNGWFFDTELLLAAERNGMRTHEVPVHWTDDPDSRVKILRTAAADVAGLVRVKKEHWRGQGYAADSCWEERPKTSRT